MERKLLLSALLFFAVAFPALAQEEVVRATEALAEETGAFEPISFTTIDSSSLEGRARNLPTIPPVLQDRDTWISFWEAYTQGAEPQPPVPGVDFGTETIIVSPFGRVSEVYVDRDQHVIRVVLDGAEESSNSHRPSDSLHIVRIARQESPSVVFEHRSSSAPPFVNAPDIGIASSAPYCVSLSQWETFSWTTGWRSYARATNNCGYSVRVRMIWAWAPDSSCYSVSPGWYLQGWRGGTLPYVSELRSC